MYYLDKGGPGVLPGKFGDQWSPRLPKEDLRMHTIYFILG